MKLLKIKSSKVDDLEKKNPDATTFIHINQYNAEKQNLEIKIGDVDRKNTRYKWFIENISLVTTIDLNTKIS